MGKQEIIAGVEPLIEQAIKSKKWMICKPQNILISPTRLREEMQKGNHLLGVKMWSTVAASEIRRRLVDIANEAQRKIEDFDSEQKNNLETIANDNFKKLSRTSE